MTQKTKQKHDCSKYFIIMVIIIVTTAILFKVLTVPIVRFVRVYYNILQVDTRIKNKDLIRFLYVFVVGDFDVGLLITILFKFLLLFLFLSFTHIL